MTLTDLPSAAAVLLILLTAVVHPPRAAVHALGSASTAAVISSTETVCGILAGYPAAQKIQCFQGNRTLRVQPNATFDSISGGKTFFCGLRSGGFSLLCWDTTAGFAPKRLYYSETIPLSDLTVGDDQVCAVEIKSSIARCWRGERGGLLFPAPEVAWKFRTLTSGSGFTCGILKAKNGRVACWGRNPVAAIIESQFRNSSMSTLVAGTSHACGLTVTGMLICRGNNDHGQLEVPFSSAFEFSEVALGADFSCAIRRRNSLVACWGGKENRFQYDSALVESLSFEAIVPGLDFVCGLVTGNLTIICWGPGWTSRRGSGTGSTNNVPLGMIIPGPCVKDSCSRCGPYPNSVTLCGGNGNICRECTIELPIAVPLPPVTTPSPPSQGSRPLSPAASRMLLSRLSLTFLIVGSVGVFVGICTIIYCLWAGVCCSLCHERNVDHRFEPSPIPETIVDSMANTGSNVGTSRLLSEKGYRSGSSSSKQTERTEKFSFSDLTLATNDFSPDNRIGSGSFGAVYKGKLPDGRVVAIKRGETNTKRKKFQEKEIAFGSELSLLTRLHHKHLVGLVGFCQEEDERLLVYEYMSNGALHDHLHSKDNVERKSSLLNSWKMRIKVALDAARGIEYLHNYAVPPIVHRDIKSSNILLDANWTARVSDFGLSLMGPDLDRGMLAVAVGTVGYIDPEYYVMNVLTTKSDVYGLGVVLLELLTGKRAVFRDQDGAGPIRVVDYAVPAIMAGELRAVLDGRVEAPASVESGEAKAVEMVAHLAIRCVNLEGKERPNMSDVVSDLERAFGLCEDCFSNSTFSISSE